MAKQLNVDMRFTADTAKAKQAITELQSAIQKLGYGSSVASSKIIDPAQFEQASAAARELAYHLNNAYNAKTGNLDLSKLNASLKSSNTDLNKLTANFKNAGPIGQQAFVALAQAIATADQPTVTLNTHLSTMFTTIKNVARFQISSSIIHGLIGGIQSAYSYAQNLNQSLNNIRIVTGQNTDQMARFAEQANKTARSLSATTLDYTNASLIYYQQGLDDEAVKARTDVTVKLANVSRQSAEEVSSQMTAIWENFDAGAHSMEYFADVITALGATTASSSEEIATGLSKFAPVAGTIGLSYEKATSILAAIVANTRQSADTVGTGLRTIFSRFESLKLGETLEDGVDLNKYTKAMQTIGVNVLDANGKLRDMDSILDDVAKNWEKLDNTEKTAFATTVGGVRQYTNLMALFENWDDVQKNMLTASGSEGTLQKQADIYAESWEAARDRVKAAAESLYDTLIDDKFFININKGVESLLVGINNFLTSFGGVKSVVISLLSFILAMTANKIGPAVQKVVQDIQIMTGGASKVYQKMQNDFNSTIDSQLATGQYSTVDAAQLKSSQQLLLAKTKLGAVIDKLSAKEKMAAELDIQGMQLQAEHVKKLAEEKMAADKKVANAQNEVVRDKFAKRKTYDEAKTKAEDINAARRSAAKALMTQPGTTGYTNLKVYDVADEMKAQLIAGIGEGTDEAARAALIESINSAIDGSLNTAREGARNIKQELVRGFLEQQNVEISTQVFNFDELGLNADNLDTAQIEQYKAQIEVLGTAFEGVKDKIANMPEALEAISKAQTPDAYKRGLELLKTSLQGAEISAEDLGKVLKKMGVSSPKIDAYTKAYKAHQQATEELTKAEEELNKAQTEGNTDAASTAQQKLAQARKNAAAATEEFANAEARLATNAKEFEPTRVISGIESITSAAAGFGQLAMTINSIKTLFNTWGDASTSLGEKLSATFMAISMAVPGLIGTFTSFSTVIEKVGQSQIMAAMGASAETAALTANNAEKAKSILLSTSLLTEEGRLAAVEQLVALGYSEAAAQDLVRNSVCTVGNVLKAARIALSKGEQAETAKETLAYIAENGALWAQVAARLALRVVENPALAAVMLGMIIATTAAIWVSVAATKKQTEAVKAEREAQQEAASAAKEHADANRDLVNSFEEALAAYKAAKEAGEDLTASQEKLASAAKDVANAYHIAGAALAEYTGDYTNFEQKVNEARAKEVAETIAAAKKGKAAAAGSLLEASTKGKGYTYIAETDDEGNTLRTGYKAHFGDGFLGGADDRIMANIVSGGNFKYLSKQAGDNSINLKMTDFNAENLIAAYDEVGQVLEKARATMTSEELAKSETYQKMNEWYTRMQESAEQYKKYAQDIADLEIENKDRSGVTGIKSSEVDSLEKYQQLRQGLIDNLKKEKGITDESSEEFQKLTASVDAYLGSLESLSKFKLQNDAIKEFNEIAGVDIQQWAKDNGVDLEIALKINPYLPEETWDEQIALIQAKADREKIKLKIEVAEEGQELAGDSKTTSTNWVDWKQQFSSEDWNRFLETSGLSSFTDFLMLSDEDKQKVLANWEDLLEQEGEVAREKEREETEARLEANKAWMTENTGEVDDHGDLVYTHEAEYQAAKSENENLQFGLNAWEKRKNNGTLTDAETAAIEGWTEASAQAAATQIENNNKVIETYEGVETAIEADKASLQRMADEDEAQAAYGWMDDLKEKAENLGFDFNEIKEYAQYLEKTGKAAGLTQEELLKLATKQKMLERGLDSLNDNAEDFYDLLDSGKKDTAEFADSLEDMQDAVVDIVGGPNSDLDGSIFDAKFFEDNRKIIEKAADGDLEAIEALQTAAAKKIVSKMELEGPTQDKINKVIDDMQAAIPDDIKIGTSIGEIEGMDGYLASLNQMMASGELTRDQVNAILSSIGFDPVITYKTMTVDAIGEAKVDGSHDVTLTDPDGNTVHMTLSGDAVEGAKLGSTISLPVINADATKSTGTGGGGGGSSGGGGGSSSKKDKPTPDRSSRYHRITKKQDNNSRALSKAADAKDRYAGKAKLDNLNKEIDLTKEAIALDKERLAEAQQWLEIDRKDLDNALKDVDLAAQIGPDNVIENYQQLFDDLLLQEQNLVDQLNQGLIDEDKYNEEKDKIDAAKDAMDNWEETIEEIQNTEDDLLDKTNEYFDLILSIATTKLELNLEVNDQDLELLDHLITKLEDDAYKSAEAIALMGDKMGRELERATYYQNAINETLGAYGIYSMEQLASMSPEELKNLGITSDTIDNLKDWNSELLSITETLDDLRDEIVNRVIDGFDTLQDKVQESYDYFSHWNTVLEDYRDIVDLNMGALGGKESRALIKQIDDSLLKNSTNALRSSKQMYDTLVESRTEAQKKLEEAMAAGRIGDIKHYEDVLADIDGKIKESQEQWLSDWSDGLQKAQDILTRAVEDAVAEYDKLLSPVYGSLDYLNEAYDRGKEVDEDYVQDYEKLYQLNKLNRDLTKVLNDTDGVKNREQLIKLQEKINKLQKDKTKMSEYDLEVLRKEFEVQQARIALEEAANAKSTVRLQRDNEGNWGYVYTSDFEATEELQQSYEDKLHEYQQLNDEYMSEMSDKLMELSQNARDRISEIWSDATLTQEEKEARIAEVMNWFNAQRNYIEEQMGHAIDNQAALTDRFYATYQNMQAEVRDTFAETVLSQTMNIEQLSEVTGLLTTDVASLVEAGRLASLEYLASMEEINEAAGTTMDELANNISSAVDQITIASDANVDTITELSETVQIELLNSLDAAIEAEEKFAQQIAETTANVEAQAAALADALRILNDYSGALSSSEIGNPLDTLSQSEEKYGIDQPAYNENDWLLNKDLEEIFDAVYDEIKSDASHSDFLEMYGAMNDWLTLLQTQAGSAMQGFGSIMSPYYQTPESETLEQQVHIEANFPGVTNSSEIEEAFENLVNKAAQFANRKRQG